MDSQTKLCIDVTCTVTNCVGCDAQGKCKSCFPGYSLQNNECVPCNVEGCNSCSTSPDLCDVGCKSGMILFKNSKSQKYSCAKCGAGCQECKTTDISECVGCTPGYYPEADKNSKIRCKKCFTNCE